MLTSITYLLLQFTCLLPLDGKLHMSRPFDHGPPLYFQPRTVSDPEQIAQYVFIEWMNAFSIMM